MNTKRNFISETLIIVACFIVFLGLSSISFTISADEETMAAIHYLTTNEIKETTNTEKNKENIEKTNDIEIKNTIVFSSNKFDIIEVEILPGESTSINTENNNRRYTLWNLDEGIKEIIEKFLK